MPHEPPYVSNLRITLPGQAVEDSQLSQRLQAQLGITEVVEVPEEKSTYVKVDTPKTNCAALEKAIAVQCRPRQSQTHGAMPLTCDLSGKIIKRRSQVLLTINTAGSMQV